MVKIRNAKIKFSSQGIQTPLRLRLTWSGGNKFAWDGKNPGFEPYRTFFKQEIDGFKKMVGLLLSLLSVCFVDIVVSFSKKKEFC